MKVRVAYTVDVPDEYRRAIRMFYGQPGLATRDEVRNWLRSYGDSENDNLMFQFDKEHDDEGEGV